tara:strand:+ start:156 stop:767 length:612 start_codon:yes stop_codon:yes gene_type:complete
MSGKKKANFLREKVSANYFPQVPHQDPRNDLGYGRQKLKFSKPRSFYQYPEEEEEDEAAADSINPVTYDAVLSKLLNYSGTDFMAKKGSDPYHFVDGTTKIAEISTAKGMVPFPSMYKSKQAVVGGTAQRLPAGPTLAFRTRIRPTGTKKGLSQAPIPEPAFTDVTGPKYELEDIISIDPDQEHLTKVRALIRMIHQEQENNK